MTLVRCSKCWSRFDASPEEMKFQPMDRLCGACHNRFKHLERDFNLLKEENDSLKKKVAELQSDLDAIKFGWR